MSEMTILYFTSGFSSFSCIQFSIFQASSTFSAVHPHRPAIMALSSIFAKTALKIYALRSHLRFSLPFSPMAIPRNSPFILPSSNMPSPNLVKIPSFVFSSDTYQYTCRPKHPACHTGFRSHPTVCCPYRTQASPPVLSLSPWHAMRVLFQRFIHPCPPGNLPSPDGIERCISLHASHRHIMVFNSVVKPFPVFGSLYSELLTDFCHLFHSAPAPLCNYGVIQCLCTNRLENLCT